VIRNLGIIEKAKNEKGVRVFNRHDSVSTLIPFSFFAFSIILRFLITMTIIICIFFYKVSSKFAFLGSSKAVLGYTELKSI